MITQVNFQDTINKLNDQIQALSTTDATLQAEDIANGNGANALQIAKNEAIIDEDQTEVQFYTGLEQDPATDPAYQSMLDSLEQGGGYMTGGPKPNQTEMSTVSDDEDSYLTDSSKFNKYESTQMSASTNLSPVDYSDNPYYQG